LVVLGYCHWLASSFHVSANPNLLQKFQFNRGDTELTHERQRGSYMNLINLVFIICDSIGPIVGGAFAKSGNWRWM
jgi:MFS family permease